MEEIVLGIKNSLMGILRKEGANPINEIEIDLPQDISEATTDDILILLVPFINSYSYRNSNISKSKKLIIKFMTNLRDIYSRTIDLEYPIKYNTAIENSNEIICEIIKIFFKCLKNDNSENFICSDDFSKERLNILDKNNSSSNNNKNKSTPGSCASFINNSYNSSILNLERKEKIFVHKVISNFNPSTIDWDDKDNLIGILKYCVGLSIQLYFGLIKEEKLVNIEDKNNLKTKTFVIRQCGHTGDIFIPDTINKMVNSELHKRSDLLKRRINPQMTLDEYAKLIMDDMKKTEEYKKAIEEIEISSEETQREKDISKDDQNDLMNGFAGKTKKQG